jgi:hypothetical protein
VLTKAALIATGHEDVFIPALLKQPELINHGSGVFLPTSHA